MNIYATTTTTTITANNSSRNETSTTPLKRKMGDTDNDEGEEVFTPSKKEARISPGVVGVVEKTILIENDPLSGGNQNDFITRLNIVSDTGLNKEDKCQLKDTMPNKRHSKTSNDDSPHFSSQISPRHHRGNSSQSPKSSHIVQNSSHKTYREEMNCVDKKTGAN